MKTQKNYKLVVGMNEYIVNSRDAKKHAQNHGQEVSVFTMSGKLVSHAKIDENGKPYNVNI